MARPIDKEFDEADDTGVLDLSGRNLRQFPLIPGELLDFSLIFEADLSRNRFDKLPKEVITFKALVKIDCHHNNIRWLPEELFILSNLKEINFSRNFLQKLPGEICSMNLHSIDVSNNRLTALPTEMGQLKNIQFLNLSCNMLQELPKSFFMLSKLCHLNLHRNYLRDISEDVGKLEELHYLDVSSNLLSRIPVSLRHIKSLQILCVGNNPMESPPLQLCARGLVHICKYLERLAKRGSDSSIDCQGREDTLKRRERSQKRLSNLQRPVTEISSITPGGCAEVGLLDELASLVNKTFGEKDGEITPTGSLHWSMEHYVTQDKVPSPVSPGKDYRDAAYRLYMQQEGGKGKHKFGRCPSSPSGSSSLHEVSGFTTPSLSKLKSEENVHQSSGGDGTRPINVVRRSLSSEKFPRSGSWNSHKHISSPVLPNKYIAPDRMSEEKSQEVKLRRGSSSSGGASPTISSINSSEGTTVTTQLSTPPTSSTSSATTRSNSSSSSNSSSQVGKSSSSSSSTSSTSSKVVKKKPPPLDTSMKPHNDEEKCHDSDHEGSLTPTNDTPPTIDTLDIDTSDDPLTPKDEKVVFELPFGQAEKEEVKLEVVALNKSVSFASTVEDIPPSIRTSTNKPKPIPPPKSAKRLSAALSDNVAIQVLEGSPIVVRRNVEQDQDPSNHSNEVNIPITPDGTWPRMASPRRRNEKSVFKMLKESDPNYTIRRQKLQMSLLLEKNQLVKTTVENLVGLTLSDDIGEWVTDGVVLCQVINNLHPGTISNIHSPSPGQTLSRIKQTINISAFIDACRTLKISEEELCSAGDIIEMKDPVRVVTCLQRVLESKPGNLA